MKRERREREERNEKTENGGAKNDEDSIISFLSRLDLYLQSLMNPTTTNIYAGSAMLARKYGCFKASSTVIR